MNNTIKLLESIQNNLKEGINYNLPDSAETFTKFKKAENYNKATDACKINAFKANIDLGEDIYAGTITLQDNITEPHYFNVVNDTVQDHSNIFATGTPIEYKGINLSSILDDKGFTPTANGNAKGPNGEILDITVTTGGIIFSLDGKNMSYNDFIKNN